MKRICIVSLIVISIFLFSACSSSDGQLTALQAEIDSLKVGRDELAEKNSEKESENNELKNKISEYESVEVERDSLSEKISVLESENNELKNEIAEFESLKQKYGQLSEAEILAQTAANTLKAEEDRIAVEKIKAEELAVKQKEEEERKAAEAEEAKRGYNTGITYEQLARTPDDYKNKKVKFYGVVVQVLENDNEVNLRVAIDEDYDTIAFIYYPKTLLPYRVLENDEIILYGISKGLYTYKSTLGGNITIPLIEMEQVAPW